MASRDIESLILVMSADIRQLKRNLDEANGVFDRKARQMEARQKQLEKKFERLGESIGDGIKKASLVAGVAFGAIIGYSVKTAASAVEMKNAFEVAFAAGTKGAEDYAAALSKKVGRSQLDIMESMTRFRLLFKDQAADIADALTEGLQARAIDVGSLFNLKDADVVQKFFSAITGEAEPVKALGVNLNETAVKAELLRLGFKGNAEQAPETAKQIARYNILMRETQVAQGDAAKTIDSTANSFKRLQGEVKDSAAKFGEQFLPIADKVLKWATEALTAFNKLPEGMQIAGLAALGLVAAAGPLTKLAAGLGNIIKLANEARVALAGVATAEAGAGGAGVAAAASGGLGLAGSVTAGTGIGMILAAPFIPSTAPAFRKARDNPAKATDAQLATAIEYATKNINLLTAQNSAAGRQILANLRADLALLKVEQAKRGGGQLGAAPGAPPAQLTLSDLQKLPVGGGAGKGGRAPKGTKDDPIVTTDLAKDVPSFDPFTGKENPSFEERQLQDWLDQRFPSPDALPNASDMKVTPIGEDDFNRSVRESQKLADEAQQQWQESVYDGIVGGLHAAADGNLMDYLKYRLREAIFSSVADGLTQAFTQAIANAQGGSGFINGALRVVGSVLGFPAHAAGTAGASKGWAIVGEHGPELVRFGRAGAQVTANSGLRAAMQAEGSRVPQSIYAPTFHLHAEGAVMTPELIAGLNAQAQQYAASAGAQAYAAARRSLPGWAQQTQRLGG